MILDGFRRRNLGNARKIEARLRLDFDQHLFALAEPIALA